MIAIRQRLERLEGVAQAESDVTSGRTVYVIGGAYLEDAAQVDEFLRSQGVTMTPEDVFFRQSAPPNATSFFPMRLESIQKRAPSLEFILRCLTTHYTDGTSIGDHLKR